MASLVSASWSIRNGTDHRIAHLARTLPGPEREKRLLFVGRLSVQKNIPLMLDSIAAFLRRSDQTATLRVVGDGPERSRMVSAIERLGLTGAVTLLERSVGLTSRRSTRTPMPSS